MASVIRTVNFIMSLAFGIGTLVFVGMSVLATEYNRILMFKEPVESKILPGNVIRTEKVANEGGCRVKCYLEPNCVAINVGPANDQGQRNCELKNFTDESQSRTGLKEKKGHIHYAVENFCHSSPCRGKNVLCQVGFTDKGYRCVCRDGFKGEKCDEDVDECNDGLHNCGDASNCENIHGSFYCICNDETKCEASISLATGVTPSSARTFSLLMATSLTDSSASKAPLTPTASLTTQLDSLSSKTTLATTATSTASPASTSHFPRLDSPLSSSVTPMATSTALSTASIQLTQPACQQGWIGYGKSCYKLFMPTKNWKNAQNECQQSGASLVKIESSVANDFIKRKYLTGEADYWIGLSDSDNNEGRDWKWTDGTPLDGYSNWRDGQPNNYNGNQDCVAIRMGEFFELHYNAEWHDDSCSDKKKYICEKP